jgi:uncharacterized membrane protein
LFEFFFKYSSVIFDRGDFSFSAPWPVYALAIIGAGIAVPTLLRYQQVKGKTGSLDRGALAALRVAILGVLLFSLFRPVLVLSTVVPQKNFVGVLLDDSRSMRIADVDDTPRGAFINREFAPEGGIRTALEERFLVRSFGFGSSVQRTTDGSNLVFASGKSDLASALEHARQELASVPLAGLVLVSDGADNAGEGFDEALLSLKAAGVPVHTVGLGVESFDRDIALTRVNTPRSVLKGTSLVVDLLVSQNGYRNQTVQLVVEDDGRIVSSQDVTLGEDGEAVAARVHFTVTEAGPRAFTFRIPEQDGELVSQNNEQLALINVRDRAEKILYFEGEPRWEVAFIRRAIQGDENLHLVVLNRTAENKFFRGDVEDSLQLITGFPTTREELFEYSGLILGSIEASYFTHDQLNMIVDFVGQRGGGLLLLGGRHAFAEGGYIGTPVEDVIPVELGPPAAEDFFTQVTVETTPTGAMHPVVQIADTEASSATRWTELPPVSIVNPITSVKPGATTLLSGESGSGDKQVVLATQRYGRGKSVAMPIQDSWTWQMHADIPLEDQTHEILWKQLLRYLVSSVPDRVQINLPADRVAPGEALTLLAEVDDDQYLKVNNTEVIVRVTSPLGNEWSSPMDWTVDRDGEYGVGFVTEEKGLYEILIEAREDGEFIESERAYLQVTDLAREYYDAEMRRSLLERIAEETGGAFYTADRADRLPEEIVFTQSGTTVIQRNDLWNMPILFLMLLTLVSVEWGYRRLRGLV